ncbi:SCO family protein [Thiobacter aerophilum]|uniref:Cytochrome C oxidase subunit I n=1 Tax=Thiobacter aerophilum TaxID=3121275 RepID=A0ABV0EHL9_9BURK
MQDDAGRGNRAKFLLVLAVFLAPVVASYLFYYVWPPKGAAVNYGELIEPVSLPSELTLALPDGTPLPLRQLRGKWLLLHAAPSACDAVCARQFDALRRVRLLQGRDQARVQVVWLLTDAGVPDPALLERLGPLRVVRDPHGDLARRLPARHGLTGHLYVIDPLGNAMMRYDLDPDLKRMGKDLARLLKASQIG